MEGSEIKPILESLLFISEDPVRIETLAEILPEWSEEAILEGLRQIKTEYDEPSRGLELVEVAGGYQFRTKPQWAGWIARFKKVKAVKFSQAALETLAIIAYRQPIIRSQIEQIRGVDSGWILRTLMEKGLIKMMGRKELPGRPIVYGTTQTFLELFGLSKLSDLPTIKEIQPPSNLGEIPTEMATKSETEPDTQAQPEVSVIEDSPRIDKPEE